MLQKKALSFKIIILMFVASYAQDKENGFYFDIHFAYNSIGSEFDGERILIAADDVFAVPDFDVGIGFGLSMGYRYEELYIELAFQRTQHDFIWTGIKGDAVHSIWSINLRRVFFKDSRLQPFLQLGWMPVMPLRVNDGTLLVSQSLTSDAIFIGDISNFNAGGGIEFALKPKISVRLSIVYKRAKYVSVKSSEENIAIKLDEDINANDVNMSLGVIFVL
jgi:opacity protein-like surface antigen